MSREFSNSSDVVEENRHEGIYTAFRCVCEWNMKICQLRGWSVWLFPNFSYANTDARPGTRWAKKLPLLSPSHAWGHSHPAQLSRGTQKGREEAEGLWPRPRDHIAEGIHNPRTLATPEVWALEIATDLLCLLKNTVATRTSLSGFPN